MVSAVGLLVWALAVASDRDSTRDELFEGDDVQAQAAQVREPLERITDECQAALETT